MQLSFSSILVLFNFYFYNMFCFISSLKHAYIYEALDNLFILSFGIICLHR